jgi:hypothetical protein
MDSKGSHVPVRIYGDTAQERPVLPQTTHSGGSPATSVCGTGICRLVSQQGSRLRWSHLKVTQKCSRLPVHRHPPVAHRPMAPTTWSGSRLQNRKGPVKITTAPGCNSPSTQHCRCPATLSPFPASYASRWPPYVPAVRRFHKPAGTL